MRYVNQLNYVQIPYITRTELEGEEFAKGQKTTIRSSGCGLCSAIMVADRLLPAYDFELEDAIALSYEVEANHLVGTDYKRFAPAFAEKLHLRVEMTDHMEQVLQCLQTGGAVVAHVGGDREGHIGVFSHKGHYVAVVSVEADGRLAILDPSYKENKFEEESRKGKVEVRNQVIALCRPEVLLEDTQNRTPHFYLFWRN